MAKPPLPVNLCETVTSNTYSIAGWMSRSARSAHVTHTAINRLHVSTGAQARKPTQTLIQAVQVALTLFNYISFKLISDKAQTGEKTWKGIFTTLSFQFSLFCYQLASFRKRDEREIKLLDVLKALCLLFRCSFEEENSHISGSAWRFVDLILIQDTSWSLGIRLSRFWNHQHLTCMHTEVEQGL